MNLVLHHNSPKRRKLLEPNAIRVRFTGYPGHPRTPRRTSRNLRWLFNIKSLLFTVSTYTSGFPRLISLAEHVRASPVNLRKRSGSRWIPGGNQGSYRNPIRNHDWLQIATEVTAPSERVTFIIVSSLFHESP